MSGLNRKETEDLLNVKRAIEVVLKKGYDPKAKDEDNKNLKKILENASKVVATVTDMKGYFPS